MAYVRALVMTEYQVIDHLIFQPKHLLWALKRTVGMRRLFQVSNCNSSLMSLKKKIQFYALNCVYLNSDVYNMQV